MNIKQCLTFILCETLQTAAINDLKCKIFSSMTPIIISDLFLCFFIRKKRGNLFRLLRFASKEWNKKRKIHDLLIGFQDQRQTFSCHPLKCVSICSVCCERATFAFFSSYAHFLKQAFFQHFRLSVVGRLGERRWWNENRLVPYKGQKPRKTFHVYRLTKIYYYTTFFSASDTTKTNLVAVKLIELCFVLISP